MSNNNNYGCGSLLLDIFLTCVTGGFWLIWIFVREMRKNQMIRNPPFNTARKAIHDNSPTILTAFGVVGTISTALLTGRASYTAAQVVMHKEADLKREQDPLTFKEKATLVWTLYIPAGVSGVITVASIVTASQVSANRTAAIATAYSVSEKAFAGYKEKVVEQLGERKEQKVRDEIVQEQVAQKPPSGSQLVIIDGSKMLCFESYTGRYFHSDVETIKKAQNEINSTVINELYASLSDLYYLLGLPKTSESDNLGWNSDKLLEIEFTSVLSEEDKPCLALTYNYIKPI